MKEKNSFILYKSFYAPISRLSDEMLGKLFRAIFLYQIEGKEDVLDEIQMPFDFFINQFKIDEEKYRSICDKRSNAGKAGNQKRWAEKENITNVANHRKCDKCEQKSQDITKIADNDNVNDNVNDNEKYKNPKGYEKFNLSFVEETFREVFFRWLDYKRGRGEKYKVQSSIEVAYRKLKELSNSDPNLAISIVEQSLANNWAGLFALKNIYYGNNGNSNEQSIRKVGEAVLGDIFAEIEERRRTEGASD